MLCAQEHTNRSRYHACMDQEQQSASASELFMALREYVGPDAHTAVVAPWLEWAEVAYRAELAEAADRLCRETFDGPATARAEFSWELYALSRVSDVLLLAFQPPIETTQDTPWAHKLHPLDQWPDVTMTQYRQLFARLGMVPFRAGCGHT